MTTIDLAPLTADDLAEAVALEARTYPTPWSERVFSDELAAPGRKYVKAVAGDRLVGYAGLMLLGEDAHVTTVVVDPDHRGGGIGTRLMLDLVDEARSAGATSLTLEVRVSNEAAQALYRRFGMAPVGVRKKYYVTEDALIMWVHDIGSAEYGARLSSIRSGLS